MTAEHIRPRPHQGSPHHLHRIYRLIGAAAAISHLEMRDLARVRSLAVSRERVTVFWEDTPDPHLRRIWEVAAGVCGEPLPGHEIDAH